MTTAASSPPSPTPLPSCGGGGFSVGSFGRVDIPDREGVFALGSWQAYRWLLGTDQDSLLLIPRAYQLDAITAAVLWAVAAQDKIILLLKFVSLFSPPTVDRPSRATDS
ncbi:hypothetical protein ACQEVC_24260 [Plantactinospora sp. CA-294935]|uniref:hypothetical protein n=1 Tax=Plantactinospora sp. CA-294935 TaxID=3240012 RepID=UPI003D8EC7F1